MSEQSDPLVNQDRLAALAALGLMDSPAEEPFDRLTRLAASLVKAPVALVSLVDADRQFFKSCIGLPEPWNTARQTPLSHSFCQHAVRTGEPLLIDDSRAHALFAGNPAIDELGVVAYAGIPLIDAQKHVLGSFCVVDHQPRHWDAEEVGILENLAASVMTEIDLRTTLDRERLARADAEIATEHLRRVAEELELVDRRKTQFLATLAHELRNPLGAISNGVALLDLVDQDERQKVQELMARQVSQIARLVADLMDVSRIAEGKVELSKEKIALQQVIVDAAETVAPQLEQSHHTLNVDCPAALLEVDADHVRLVQVLSNLLANACRYTPSGGQIDVAARTRNGHALLVVKDDGVGIAKSKLSSIFEMFSQAEEGEGARKGGLGIGLTLVRKIVELHGGDVVANSEGIGRGSEFRVRLPLEHHDG